MIQILRTLLSTDKADMLSFTEASALLSDVKMVNIICMILLIGLTFLYKLTYIAFDVYIFFNACTAWELNP